MIDFHETAGLAVLAEKLHLKAGMRVAFANAPTTVSLNAPGVVLEKSLTHDLDLVMVFATTQKELRRRWSKAVAALKPDGALWVAYPKKSSGIRTDLGARDWDLASGSGWSPVGMIGVDEVWSAVRFKHAPGLEEARHRRQQETIRDADGTICVDRAARTVTAPKDLRQLIARNANAQQTFDGLSFTNRKEYVVWILDAKRPETRADRLEKTVQKLAKGKTSPSAK